MMADERLLVSRRDSELMADIIWSEPQFKCPCHSELYALCSDCIDKLDALCAELIAKQEKP